MHEIETIWGPRCFTRCQGEALHPDREPLETLDRIRRTIGEYNFAGQYQQSPAPLGGGLVKAEWFKRYRENELPGALRPHRAELGHGQQSDRAQRFLGVHDLGSQGTSTSFSLIVFRQRLEYPALKRAVREQQQPSMA